MARKTNKDRLEEIGQVVEANPGKSAGAIAALLGLDRSTVLRTLPAMEDEGILLAEDDHGRLTFFGRRR